MSGKSDIFESAFFISPEEEDQGDSNFPGYIGPPAGYLRRRFFIEPGKKCVLYVGVHGVAEIYINRTPLTKGVLFPGPFDYYKGLPVGVFDVTSLLRKGENEFAAVLGNGWYRSYAIAEKKRNLYGSDLSLIAALYSDGICVMHSDNSFEASNSGPIRENDLVLGESYDATFGRVVFSRSARELDIKKNYESMQKTVISDSIMPHDIVTAKRISMDLCDFGRFVSGGITFTIYDAPAGGNVTFTFVDSPEIEKRSLERNRRISYRTKRGTNNYTSHFSVFSMRYAVIDADFDLRYFKLSAIPYYSEMKVRAAFRSSNSEIDTAFKKCIDSAKGFFTGLFSDGYSSKGEGAGKMIYLTAGAKGMLDLLASEENLRKYLKRIFEWQKKNGAISPMNPNQRDNGKDNNWNVQSAGWGDSVIEAAYRMYDITGDGEILLENYDLMKNWFSYFEKKASAPSLIPGMRSGLRKKNNNTKSKYLVDYGVPLGDSASDIPDPSERTLFADRYRDMGTAYLCHSGKLMEKIARALVSYVSMDSLIRSEFLDDIGHFEEVGEGALLAYRQAFAKKEDLPLLSVDALIRALGFDLLPDEGDEFVTKKEAGERLNSIVSQREFSFETLGPIALSMLPETLYEAGYKGTAFKVLLHLCKKDGPYTPEYLTAIGSFVIKHICGIHYSKGVVTMQPQYCPLKNCEGVFEMPNKERVIFGYEFFPDETIKVLRMDRVGVKPSKPSDSATVPSSPEK